MTTEEQQQDGAEQEQAQEAAPTRRRRTRTTSAEAESQQPDVAVAAADAETKDAKEAKPARRRKRATAGAEPEQPDVAVAAADAETKDAEEAKPARRRKRATAEAEPEQPDVAVADADTETKDAEEAKPARRRKRATAEAEPEQPDVAVADADAETKDAEEAKPARRRRRPAAEEEPPKPKVPLGPPRLLEKIRSEIGPVMVREFGYTSAEQVPRLTKVVLNIGMGEALVNAKTMESAAGDLTMISGQKPMTTRAKKSIAGFKIRDGMGIGLSVTLRGRRMHEFVDRLISSALPRIRDFQGVSRNGFDGRGNYSLGIREQVIFPEIDYNAIDRIRGLQIVIVSTARTDAEGMRFLELVGMPFTRTRDVAQVA